MKAEETDEKKASVFFMKSFFEILHLENAMTKKQAEMLDLQIQKEHNIREETKKADSIINKATSILLKVVESNSINIKLPGAVNWLNWSLKAKEV